MRAELQGAFNAANNLMRDDLRAAGLIPTTEPFTALGFTHAGGGGGETVSPAMLANTGMNAVVDWVLIELRNKNSPSTIVATRSAFIQRDGDVVGTNGSNRILFNFPADNYYVALRHRNHLGVMTATSVPFSASATSVDLISADAAIYGVNARSILTSSRMGLWSGNTYRDGQVKYTGSNNDRDPVLVQVGSTTPNNQTSGYSLNDTNLDGLVRYTGSSNDRDLILQIVGGTTPNNSRVEQLP